MTQLKVAAILDDFSLAAFGPECHLLPLNPVECPRQLADFQPDLLLVESAWRGQDAVWQDRVAKDAPELRACIQWCRQQGIPTVFWNKEDPVHFGTFLSVARHFDHVFTTDIDCIPRYRRALRHDRVSLLPFAAQPRLHNPLVTLPRRPGFCFAGSWYQRYPARQRDFTMLANIARAVGPLVIYDRNHGNPQSETRFPEEYGSLILGGLPFGRIDQAYKGYRYGLNVNTVTRSRTMFARRVFELMASNTVVVSNESQGMRLLFGNLVLAADDPAILLAALRSLWNDETRYRKQRLMGLRAVLREHTYAHRLSYLLSRLRREPWQPDLPEVLVLAVADSPEAENRLVENLARQTYPARRGLLLRRHGGAAGQAGGFTCLSHPADCLRFLDEAQGQVHWLGVFSAEDIYGPHYLTDLVQARHYSSAAAFGKVSCHVAVEGRMVLAQEDSQYRPAKLLWARSALVRRSVVSRGWLEACLHDPGNARLEGMEMLGTDEFHYGRNGASLPLDHVLSVVGDFTLPDQGLSLARDILPRAEALTAAHYRPPEPAPAAMLVKGATLREWLIERLPGSVTLEVEQNGDMILRSSRSAQAFVNLYASPRFTRDQLNLADNNRVRLLVEHDLAELLTVFEYQDAEKRKIGHTMNQAEPGCALLLPDGCVYLRFALRLRGPGVARIRALVLGETFDPPTVALEPSETAAPRDAGERSHPGVGMEPPMPREAETSPSSLIGQAHQAFHTGDYAGAMALYERAMAARPELAHVYRFDLELARERLAPPSGIVAAPRPAAELPPASPLGTVSPPGPAGVTLADFYREVARTAGTTPAIAPDSAPLVSVLMTARDVEAYIEASVTSVLRQTWPRLELIVVDDASTDGTWAILQRLEKSEVNLRCRRLNTHLGTYFAKNHALTLARGTFIFFQDGDDISHPERIRLCMEVLTQPQVVCVCGSYSRVRYPSGEVLPVNGMIKKVGVITLGVPRRVFDEIGFFNCTSKASDYEFFQRLKLWAKKQGGVIRNQESPLYYNTLREGSLFADMIVNDPDVDGHIEQQASASRADYAAAFARKHKELGVGGFRSFFRFPVLRDLIPVAPDMSYLPNPALPVVLSLCSIPERAEMLRATLESLAPQVDELHLYLDRYEAVPDFVRRSHPRVRVALSRDQPGLRDNGKFLPYPGLSESCYYFTADDDILYPPDYVAAMIRRIEHYGRLAVVGVHGVLVPEAAPGYFSSYRKVFLFWKGLESDALVNNLGTGTVAFHSDLLRGLDLTSFPRGGMADVFLSVYCRKHRIPMLAIARPDEWLMEQRTTNISLFEEFSRDDEVQAAVMREHRPWGYAAIREAVEQTARRLGERNLPDRLSALLPALHFCLK